MLDNVFLEIKNIVNSLGFTCLGVFLAKEDGTFVVRIYLDIEGHVDLSDCETVSRSVAEYLDTVDKELPEHYLLEVTSPGLERPLFSAEDFDTYSGKNAEILTKKNKKYNAILNGFNEDNSVNIIVSGEKIKILFDDIKNAHLIYTKETGQKKTFKKILKKKKN